LLHISFTSSPLSGWIWISSTQVFQSWCFEVAFSCCIFSLYKTNASFCINQAPILFRICMVCFRNESIEWWLWTIHVFLAGAYIFKQTRFPFVYVVNDGCVLSFKLKIDCKWSPVAWSSLINLISVLFFLWFHLPVLEFFWFILYKLCTDFINNRFSYPNTLEDRGSVKRLLVLWHGEQSLSFLYKSLRYLPATSRKGERKKLERKFVCMCNIGPFWICNGL